MKRLIAITGTINSGKNTVANIIQEEANCEVFIDAFAAPLKNFVADVFAWDLDVVKGENHSLRHLREKSDEWWSQKFEYDVTIRKMLQYIGTDVMREHLHEDIWVNSLIARYNKFCKLHDNFIYIVSDLRFPNESFSIQDAGGEIIRVKREDPPWWDFVSSMRHLPFSKVKEKMGASIHAHVHVSEWAIALIEPNKIIANDGTLEDLRDEIKKIILA